VAPGAHGSVALSFAMPSQSSTAGGEHMID
jgi:hypothetical protein